MWKQNFFLDHQIESQLFVMFIMMSLFMFHSRGILPLFVSVQAQAVTLTVAQAFKVALDLWEIAQEGEFIE